MRTDTPPAADNSAHRFEPSRIVIGAVLEERGVAKQVQRASAAVDWPDRMGEAIARVTRVKHVDRTSIVVEVRSSAWLMELSLMKEALLERVNEGLGGEGTIDRIVLTLMEGDGS